ncbi:phospholipid/glycerol acyltransferase family protein isoform X2 [Wolffia australiana]
MMNLMWVGQRPLLLPVPKRFTFVAQALKPNRGISFCSPVPFSNRSHGFGKRICLRKIKRLQVVARAGSAGIADPSDFSANSASRGFPWISRVRAICFYLMTGITAIFLFMAMILAHPFVLLCDRHQRKAHHWIAKTWAWLTILPFYSVEFQGLENLPPDNVAAVYVSNHQSFLDIYTLLTLGKSFKFISKRSIFLFPVIGWAMFLLGIIPIRRMDTRSQMDCLKRCIELVKKGTSVYFFPEGTRSKDGKLGTFKKGAFSVASKTGASVVAVTLMGTGVLMPSGMEGFLNSGNVKVVIHKPLEGNNAEELMDSARSTIADTLLLNGFGVH